MSIDPMLIKEARTFQNWNVLKKLVARGLRNIQKSPRLAKLFGPSGSRIKGVAPATQTAQAITGTGNKSLDGVLRSATAANRANMENIYKFYMQHPSLNPYKGNQQALIQMLGEQLASANKLTAATAGQNKNIQAIAKALKLKPSDLRTAYNAQDIVNASRGGLGGILARATLDPSKVMLGAAQALPGMRPTYQDAVKLLGNNAEEAIRAATTKAAPATAVPIVDVLGRNGATKHSLGNIKIAPLGAPATAAAATDTAIAQAPGLGERLATIMGIAKERAAAATSNGRSWLEQLAQKFKRPISTPAGQPPIPQPTNIADLTVAPATMTAPPKTPNVSVRRPSVKTDPILMKRLFGDMTADELQLLAGLGAGIYAGAKTTPHNAATN